MLTQISPLLGSKFNVLAGFSGVPRWSMQAKTAEKYFQLLDSSKFSFLQKALTNSESTLVILDETDYAFVVFKARVPDQ